MNTPKFIHLLLMDGRSFAVRADEVAMVVPACRDPEHRTALPKGYIQANAFITLRGVQEDLGVQETLDQVLYLIARAEVN